MTTIRNYLSLIKFSHTIFAMPFALIGFTLAVVPPVTLINLDAPITWSWDISNRLQSHGVTFLLIILCMVFARSAAMAFNRFLDRHFDALNPRTAIREIPAGIISADRALLFTITCSVLFIACAWFINRLCFYLSPVALLVILGYSFTKRFTALCHLVLGLGLSLAPIGAYLAVTGKFDWLPVFFSFAVIFWVSGFDIIYALQDEEFDRRNNLHSIPAALGKQRALWVSEILHLLSATSVIIAGVSGHFGWWYWIGIVVFIGMLVYQHSLVKPDDLSKVNIAFMTANGIASVVFALFVITDLLTR
ncbi:UbiA-like polyprenyltransferase [Flavihumibacter solisilvae]|uniref:4-hydroxybenzoate polyprenyltransferase n=1 Tax=Flavihumibacter solisilvae TaxID=1349421 RepID=A0A0C1ISE0_9BACT|nr:UbiA-like polyprenyltransferase [Flavihumibacter solisilvae]KIC93369.1 4-hydroxybenzoate polyprenyltransferase [Flavihumibacter solisilvae]